MMPPLVFMMGQFEASFPQDRLYAKNHMWAHPLGPQSYRFGFTAYAVRLLQDIYFLEFSMEPDQTVSLRQEIGSIESKKAESGLYAPASGNVLALNDIVLRDPSAINVDKYGDGWLFDLQCDSEEFLKAPEYLVHLEAAWDIAQRTIKGQVNA